MCGFRASLGGAQAAYGIRPDLTCLGKIIGGGLPVAAYGGRREIMEYISPAGPVYQAGTLSGNPLAMTAGIETLRILTAEPKEGKADYSRELTIKTKDLLLGWQRAAKDAGVPICAHQAGSMFGIFFIDRDVMITTMLCLQIRMPFVSGSKQCWMKEYISRHPSSRRLFYRGLIRMKILRARLRRQRKRLQQ